MWKIVFLVWDSYKCGEISDEIPDRAIDTVGTFKTDLSKKYL